MKKSALLLTAILAFSAVSLYAQSAQTRFDNGKKLFDQGDYDGAIRELNEAIRLDPKYTDAYSRRGRAYSNKNDYDRAIEDYTEVIKLDPKKVYDGYFSRGYAYYLKNDYDRAIADFEAALQMDPNYSDAMLGLVLAKNKRNDSLQSSTGIITITAKDLASAYDSNQLRANAQYKNKTVKVTGSVTGIGKYLGDNYIELDNWVWVFIKSSELNKALALNKGQTVTLTGICQEYLLCVFIKDAVFSN